MLITDDRAEKALRFLAETDITCAEAKADMERAEWAAKSTEAAIFLHEDGSVDARKAKAKTDEAATQKWTAYFEAVKQYSAIANKRETERIVIDAWRTTQANRRQGQ